MHLHKLNLLKFEQIIAQLSINVKRGYFGGLLAVRMSAVAMRVVASVGVALWVVLRMRFCLSSNSLHLLIKVVLSKCFSVRYRA